MKKSLTVIIFLILLLILEISKVYFIMPFPGSQYSNTIGIAYFINNNIWWMRLLLIIGIIFPALYYLRNGKTWQKILLIASIFIYAFIAYEVNFKLLADKMFYQPKEKLFAAAQTDTTAKNGLVIGVSINNEAKAYPIEIIGYHHQVKDTVGGEPIMVTYCTVCRTGRVYSPFVNGKYETFRLVGMDHFNAMFEDATTKSWWRQENGTAITGSLKGTQLKEIPSAQMALQDWLALHPNSLVLQPDSNFRAKYDSLKGYDAGTIDGGLEHTDTSSWKRKSWIVGATINNISKAYDWNDLLKKRMIEDEINGTALLLIMAQDNKTVYVFTRKINDTQLHFSYDAANNILQDAQTHSQWLLNGLCTAGIMKGTQLQTIQSYQEFWHSWQTFHPQTQTYR
jgi:hypothetical protein